MKIFRLVTAIVLCLAVLAGIIYAAVNRPKRPCSACEVVVNYDGEYPTVSEADILKLLKDNQIETIGIPVKDIDLEQIAKLLKQEKYIKAVNDVQCISTKLRINVTLKNILLHVYAKDGSQYFIDEDGIILPFSTAVKENVPVVNGNITVKYNKEKKDYECDSNLLHAFKVATYMHNDDFCQNQFRQLYVTNSDDLVLIPTIGRHIILFGKAENMEEKLFNLKQTYQQGLAYLGMDQYVSLDLRYKNRVIAKKR